MVTQDIVDMRSFCVYRKTNSDMSTNKCWHRIEKCWRDKNPTSESKNKLTEEVRKLKLPGYDGFEKIMDDFSIKYF